MTEKITARELFDNMQERLDLQWLSGRDGGSRILESGESLARRPSLTGYLNIIYPNKVQILGTEELNWLDELDSRLRWRTIERLFQYRPLAMIITKNQYCPEDLREAAEESGTALWGSSKRGHEILNLVQYFLARRLAPRITVHGVFMEIYSIGVLITGDSGSGKSELALELITRGHRLVADDAPEFTQIAPDVLDGTCPEMLQDLLEVRGLGILNIRQMFGDTAIKRNKYLRLVIHLAPPLSREQIQDSDPMARLIGDIRTQHILDLDVPTITLPVMAGRNLAVLTEAATRMHIVREHGTDPVAAFIARQSEFLHKASKQ